MKLWRWMARNRRQNRCARHGHEVIFIGPYDEGYVAHCACCGWSMSTGMRDLVVLKWLAPLLIGATVRVR